MYVQSSGYGIDHNTAFRIHVRNYHFFLETPPDIHYLKVAGINTEMIVRISVHSKNKN